MTAGTPNRIEALAEAWASIDGKDDRFLANREDRGLDLTDGTYPGYMEEAAALIRLVALSGYAVVPVEPTPAMLEAGALMLLEVRGLATETEEEAAAAIFRAMVQAVGGSAL
jgi:hypothetical protein